MIDECVRLVFGQLVREGEKWQVTQVLSAGLSMDGIAEAVGFRRLQTLEARGGRGFMWQRHCSRQIQKENRGGQMCTQKLVRIGS
jgi:hypothetical protein